LPSWPPARPSPPWLSFRDNQVLLCGIAIHSLARCSRPSTTLERHRDDPSARLSRPPRPGSCFQRLAPQSFPLQEATDAPGDGVDQPGGFRARRRLHPAESELLWDSRYCQTPVIAVRQKPGIVDGCSYLGFYWNATRCGSCSPCQHAYSAYKWSSTENRAVLFRRWKGV
jgi:hypothetical protein